MKFNKMFVLEGNDLITIRNNDIEVSMHRNELAKYYSTLDLTGKNKVNYEPESGSGFFLDDSKPDGKIPKEEYQQYEDVIASVGQIREDMNNPHIGKSLEESKGIALTNIRLQAQGEIYKKWPAWKQQNIDGGRGTSEEKTQMDADIKAMRDTCNRREAQIKKANNIQEMIDIISAWKK